MTVAAERGSTKTVGELDVRFHETLWQLADHELLLEVAGGLRGRIERFLRAANAALAPEELRQHAALARRARRVARLRRREGGGDGDAPAHRARRRARRAGRGAPPPDARRDHRLRSAVGAASRRRCSTAAGIDVERAACRTSGDVAAAGAEADALIVQWAPVDDARARPDAAPALHLAARHRLRHDRRRRRGGARRRGREHARLLHRGGRRARARARARVHARHRRRRSPGARRRLGARPSSPPPPRRPSQRRARRARPRPHRPRGSRGRARARLPRARARSRPSRPRARRSTSCWRGADVLTLHLPLTPSTRH